MNPEQVLEYLELVKKINNNLSLIAQELVKISEAIQDAGKI